MVSRYTGEMYDATESGVLAVSERSSLGERIAALEALVGQAMEMEKTRDDTIRREMTAAVTEIRTQIASALRDIVLRFEGVNEWRKTFGDLANNAVAKPTFEAAVKALDDKIAVNTEARTTAEARLEERDREDKRRVDERERLEKRSEVERDNRQRKMMWQVGLVVTVVSTLIGYLMRLVLRGTP